MSEYPAHFHDHPAALADLPEYRQARAALDQLVTAMLRADVEVDGQKAWIAIAADFASTNVYAEYCERCPDWNAVGLVYPHRTVRNAHHWLTAYYRCPVDGHRWTCGWAIDFPYWA